MKNYFLSELPFALALEAAVFGQAQADGHVDDVVFALGFGRAAPTFR
jgi:hypothetical protein